MQPARVLAFAAATVKVQADAGASVERQVGIAVGVATLLGTAWVVTTFVLKPLLDKWLYARLKADPEKHANTVIKSLDHDDDTRAMSRRFIDRLYPDRLMQQQQTRDLVETNADRIAFVEAAVKAQGEALTKELARAMEHMARSTDAQTRIMEKIQKELEDHSIVIARMDERISQWDGRERRREVR